jgi:RimJ/RimL family protein N-acetyltransferase
MHGAPHIRRAAPADASAFADHMVAFSRESGEGGAPHFAPVRELSREGVREAARERWRKALDEPLWGRAWLLAAPEGGRVVGHVELRGGRIEAELHRAVLGMGIQRAFVGQGHGTRLLAAAIAWARGEAGLAWIDLGVFADNAPARALYRRAGFVELETRRDAFRIEGGVSLDDVQMTLDLGSISPRSR